jgi:hypothetical protein
MSPIYLDSNAPTSANGPASGRREPAGVGVSRPLRVCVASGRREPAGVGVSRPVSFA